MLHEAARRQERGHDVDPRRERRAAVEPRERERRAAGRRGDEAREREARLAVVVARLEVEVPERVVRAQARRVRGLAEAEPDRDERLGAALRAGV